MRKTFYIVITVLAFLASFYLANHYAENKLDMPSQISQSIRWFESLFLSEQPNIAGTLLNKEKQFDVKAPHDHKQYTHVEVGKSSVCIDTSLGELQYKKVGDIYTWTDEEGIYHVSDKAPNDVQYDIYDYAGKKVFDYFSLDLNTETLPYDFNQKLTAKLNKVFELYGKLLDTSSLKKVDINLQVFRSKTGYEQVKRQHNMPAGNKSDGFYSYSNNQAYLLFRTNKRTMETAAHEATHAINRAIIGSTPRWLNEGLAEYSENINVVGNSAKVSPDSSWTKKGIVSKKLLPLSTLFSVKNEQWNSSIRSQLYATSWAFIFFMMEHPQRKDILAKLIKKEQQNICNKMDTEEIKQSLGVPVNVLQKQFSIWSKSKLRKQSI